MIKYALCLCALFIFSTAGQVLLPGEKPGNSPTLTAPYFGQKPPGMVPELFAPGIISLPDHFEHSAAVFSPEGREVYWSAKPNGERYFKIYFMKMEKGAWSERRIASFCKEDTNYDGPVLAADGNELFFDKDGDIWSAKRQGQGWSEAALLSPLINSSAQEKIGAVTKDGTIYFVRVPGFEIHVSRKVNGAHMPPQKLADAAHPGESRDMAVYVAPDESYMIIESSRDAAICELFASFRTGTDAWSERFKLPIAWGRFPSVSPDGKYLFFMTRDGIYWLRSSIFLDLKPTAVR